jgi:hypothetical protein
METLEEIQVQFPVSWKLESQWKSWVEIGNPDGGLHPGNWTLETKGIMRLDSSKSMCFRCPSPWVTEVPSHR